MTMLRCEICGELSSRVSLCQGDMHLCPGCNKKRFGGGSHGSKGDGGREKARISNFGVVINELLCFVVNKMDSLTTDILIKLCCDHYGDDEVESAKKTLFELCNNESGRFVKRQGQNKRYNNLMDMVKLLHEIDEEDLPCFVAKDLTRLPPIDVTHVDISSLMSELRSLRREISQQRDTTVRSEMGDLANEVHVLRQEISEMKNCFDNLQRASDFSVVTPQVVSPEPVVAFDSLDSSSTYCGLNNETPVNDQRVNTSSYAAVVQSQAPVSKANIPSLTRRRSPNKKAAQHSVNNEGEFTVVSRRPKRRPRPIIGTAKLDDECSIKVSRPNPQHKFFITRFAPATTPDDIINYVQNHCQISVKCEQLKTKHDSYSCFLIEMSRECADKVRDPAIWPAGILIRRFY